MDKVVITVEDFGGEENLREFYSKWNKECQCELNELWNEDFGDFYSEIADHIIEAIYNTDDEDLPPKVLEKLEPIEEYDYGGNWQLSDEAYDIALENCYENVNKDEDDGYYDDYNDECYDEDNSSNEEKACHEILEILNKYDVEIRGDELGGVWIGHNKIS